MKKSTKRLLAAVLSVVMILGALPLTALAKDYAYKDSSAPTAPTNYAVDDTIIVAEGRDGYTKPTNIPEKTKWTFVSEGHCTNSDHWGKNLLAHDLNCGVGFTKYRKFVLLSTDTTGSDSSGDSSTQGAVNAHKRLANEGKPDEDGYYTIKLTIQGNKTTAEIGTASDVVLVMDNSGSMDTVVSSGSGWGGSGNQKDRLDIAVEAGKKFADALLKDGLNNRIAVIGFAGSNGGANDDTAIKQSLDFTNSKTDVYTTLGAMKHNGGTNYTAALQKAYDYLNDRTDKSRAGYVVFLSDGAPGKQGESQNKADWNGKKQAAAIAGRDYDYGVGETKLDKLNDVKLYTIGIALQENGDKLNYLNSLSSGDDYHYNVTDANMETKLNAILSDIAIQINEVPAGTDAKMTDIINSDYFELVEGSLESDENFTVDENGHLVWEIGEIPATEKEVTFKIKVIEENTANLPVDGVLKETNSDVYLDYNDPTGEPAHKDKKAIGEPTVKLYGTQKYTLIYSNHLGSDADVTENDHTTTDVTLKEIGSDEDKINFNAPGAGEGHENVVFIGWSMTEPTEILGKDDAKPELVGKVTLNADEATTVYAVWGYDDNGTGGDNIPDIYQVTATYKIVNGKWKGDDDSQVEEITETIDLYEKVTDTSSDDYGKWVEISSTPALSKVPSTAADDVVPDTNYKTTGSWGSNTPVNGTTTISTNTTFTYTLNPADQYTYTINYDGNSGGDTVSNVPTSTTYTSYETSYTLSVSSQTPTREGYTFTGWNSEANGVGLSCTAGGEVSFPLTGSTDMRTITLYAQWEKNTAPKLSVEKKVTSITRGTETVWDENSTGKPKAEVGDTIEWTITVTNSGDAQGKFKLEDTLDGTTGTATVTAPTDATPDEDGYYTIGTATAAGVTTMTFTATYEVVEADNGRTLTNKVTLTDDDPDNTDPEPGTAEDVKVESKPDLSVTKTVYSVGGPEVTDQDDIPEAKVNDEIVWKIEVKNDGNVAGTVELKDTLTKGEGESATTETLTTFYTDEDCANAATATNGDFTVPANGSKTYYVSYEVKAADAGKKLTNSVQIGEDGDPSNADPVPVEEAKENVYVYFKTVHKNGDTDENVQAVGVKYNNNSYDYGCWATLGKLTDVPSATIDNGYGKAEVGALVKKGTGSTFAYHGDNNGFNLELIDSWINLCKGNGANGYSKDETGDWCWHLDGKVYVYKLTYDANGGTGTVPEDKNYYLSGAEINELADGSGLTLTKDGKTYEFDHWATRSDSGLGDGSYAYEEKESVTFNKSDIELYAVYKNDPIEAKLDVEKTVYSVGDTVVSEETGIPVAEVDDQITWVITVTNKGKATGYVKLADVLKDKEGTEITDGVKLYEEATSGYGNLGKEITGDPMITIPEAGNEPKEVNFYVVYTVKEADIGKTLLNTATITESNPDGTKPENPETDNDTADGVPVGGLTVEKTVGVPTQGTIGGEINPDSKVDVVTSNTYKVGDTITWTITVTNYYDKEVTFTLADVLSNGGLVQITPPAGVTADANGDYKIGAASVDADKAITPTTLVFTATYVVQASDEGKELVNKVKVTPDGSNTPIEDEAPGVEVEGKLSISKTVYSIKRGDTYVYGEDSGATTIPTAKVGDVIVWKVIVGNSGSKESKLYFKLSDVFKDSPMDFYNAPSCAEVTKVEANEVHSLVGGYFDAWYVTYTVKTADCGEKLINKVTLTETDENGTPKTDDDGKEKTQTDEAEPVEVEKKPNNTPTYNPNYNAGVQLEKGEHFNYVIGYNDGTVRPEGNITRAEVATIFFRLLTDESRKTYLSQSNSFSDVEKNMWHNVAISTLANAGILNGYTDGSFRPDANITRAEMAAIIARFAELEGATKISFTDIKGHWAEKSILLAASNGWINGYTDGSFRPDQNITRAETMAMINRVLERKVEHVEDLVKDMNTWVDNMDTTQWYYFDVQEATNYHSYQRKYTNTYAEKWVKKLTDIDWTVYQY